MSARTPVVLVALPNLPYLLGTFDTTNFQSWWKSAPFPDALDEVKKGLHIYGRSHLAIARRVDGLWAVYRSKDYGINWERAWLASVGEVIYDIVLINFGWAIMNTSAGFYETQTAGTSWTKVSNLPGASVVPAFCNIGGGDVLLCTDGRYIWRSTDIARHWTLVCDSHSILMGSINYSDDTSRSTYRTYYTNLSRPCIAGACGRVFAAAGPFLLISEDAGLTFKGYRYWMADATGNPDWYDLCPPHSLVAGRLWPVPSSPPFLITQILISSIDGFTGADVQFLVRYDDLVPLSEESALYSRIFTTYGAAGHVHGVYMGNAWFRYVFQQYISQSDTPQISAYDLPITGESYNDKLVFSAQTSVDSSGNSIVSLKYSIDGGITWIDIDASTLKVGDAGDASAATSTLFLDDNFAKLTWVSGGCDNYGSVNYVEQYRRQCLGYEADVCIKGKKIKAYAADAKISKDKSKGQNVDALLESRLHKNDQIDALLEGRQSKYYQLDRQLQGKASHESPVDVILSVDTPCPYQIDVGRMWKQPLKYYHLDALMRTIVGHGYSCDVVLVKNKLNSILSKMAGKIPQFLDLDVPEESEGAFDSKQETV